VPAQGRGSRIAKARWFGAFHRGFELVTIRLSEATKLSHGVQHPRLHLAKRALRGSPHHERP